MKMTLKLQDGLLLIFSILAIYFMAPSLDRHEGILISSAFALVNILSSRFILDRRHGMKYLAYFSLAIGTYFILFNDEPWNMIFQGGLFESSPWPLIVCSILMTLNGWLLLEGWKARIWYTVITLALQIPIGLYVGGEALQTEFSAVSEWLQSVHRYSGSWEAWQFEWMLTYYLPIFILSRVAVKSR